MTPIFDWQKVGMSWRVEWRCVSREIGGLCAMTPGIPEMQLLPVDSLISLQNVSCKTLVTLEHSSALIMIISNYILVMSIYIINLPKSTINTLSHFISLKVEKVLS